MLEAVARPRGTSVSGSARGAQDRSRSGSASGAKSKSESEGRKKSKLTQVGDEASRSARKTLLLATLDALKWDMTRVAEALELATNADVIRALKELAPDEYATAQEDGRIKRGRQPNED